MKVDDGRVQGSEMTAFIHASLLGTRLGADQHYVGISFQL